MTGHFKALTTTASIALAAAFAAPALAAGTLAGTEITNNATVNYQVSSVAQTAMTASQTVTVDRVINIALADAGGGHHNCSSQTERRGIGIYRHQYIQCHHRHLCCDGVSN